MAETNQFGQILGTPVKNWRPRARPSISKIQGRYCEVQRLDLERDGPALFATLHDEDEADTWTYLASGPFETRDELQAYLKRTEADLGYIFYTIFDSTSHKPIGLCAYLRIDPEQGSIEIGSLIFSKFLRKTRAATEAMYLLMRYVFDDLQYRRYEWKCNALNAPSCAAGKRLGFQFEGIFRQSNVIKGRNRDTAWFSIIDSEWPALKCRFEKWLDPRNFDEAGHQILKLQDC